MPIPLFASLPCHVSTHREALPFCTTAPTAVLGHLWPFRRTTDAANRPRNLRWCPSPSPTAVKSSSAFSAASVKVRFSGTPVVLQEIRRWLLWVDSRPKRSADERRHNSCYWVARKRAFVTFGVRCSPVPDFSVASVSNADEMPPIERQLYGTSTAKIFPLPGS